MYARAMGQFFLSKPSPKPHESYMFAKIFYERIHDSQLRYADCQDAMADLDYKPIDGSVANCRHHKTRDKIAQELVGFRLRDRTDRR